MKLGLIDHETPAVAPVPPWRGFSSIQVVPLHFATLAALDAAEREDRLLRFMEAKMKAHTDAIVRQMDDMMFWEPAREALANGGCRQ